jgi:hypothetical protein
MKNNCTQISTTSCIKYTGPSIPAFNVFCDEDLDIVLTNLASALADSIAQKGLEFGKVKDTTCLQFTTEERTRLNLMLDKIVNKVCELYSLKTFTPKANDIIVDLELLFKNQASEYYYCFDEVTAPNCKTTISLTSFISDILSQLCDKFDNLQAQLDEASVDVTTLKYTGAQVKNVLNCQSTLTDPQEVTILDLLKLSEDKDKSIIQLITGTSACSASTITLAANGLGIDTTQTSVKVALDDIIANVEDAINDYSVTALTPTNSGAFQASLSLTQTSNGSAPTVTINVAPHYARLYSTWNEALGINYSSDYTIVNAESGTNNVKAKHINTGTYGLEASNGSSATKIVLGDSNQFLKIKRAGLYRFEWRGYLIVDPRNKPGNSMKAVLHLIRKNSATGTRSISRPSETIVFNNGSSNLYADGNFLFINLSGVHSMQCAVDDQFGLGISLHLTNEADSTNIIEQNVSSTSSVFITKHVVSLEATEFPTLS